MKFPKNSRIEKVVSKDPTKRILLAPWLDVERSVLVASNDANILILPVEVEQDDVSGPVPIEAIKTARRDGSSLQCRDQYVVLQDGAAYPRGDFSSFPPLEQLLQQGDHVEVSFNAKLLHELAGSMGTDVVKIRIPTGESPLGVGAGPLVVLPHPHEPHVDGAMGALLPYRIARV